MDKIIINETSRALDDVAPLVNEWIKSRDTCMDGPAYVAALELAAYVKACAAPELLAELQNIANAKPETWDEETRDQFREWAQSRARAAIAKATGELKC